jgi:addiction module RelE/StbE family toxin
MKALWSPQAKFERDAVIDYIAQDNLVAALELDSRIDDLVDRLTDFPRMGKPGRVVGTRELVAHEHYVLIYEIFEKEIHILSFLHTARQYPSLLGE